MTDQPISDVILSSGYRHIQFRGGFVQLPPGFVGDYIQDKFIFQPAWNRERVNRWWRAQRSCGESNHDK